MLQLLMLCLPFIGVLFSLSLAPLVAPKIWHQHQNKILFGWSAWLILALIYFSGVDVSLGLLSHAIFYDYVPFITLISTLFVLSGGIFINLTASHSPILNTSILALGTMCGSIIGTTGAGLLFIRTFIEVNKQRAHKNHLILFYIILVCNIGGCLSPLGDPPLFLGFLKGINFFWPTFHLFKPFCLLTGLLLGCFYLIDRRHYNISHSREYYPFSCSIEGKINILFLLCVNVITIASGTLKIPYIEVISNLLLLGLLALSFYMTPKKIYEKNDFNLEPLKEVIKIFFVIFVTLIPVSRLLSENGPFIVKSLQNLDLFTPASFFWLTGMLSAFLDNAPTYLVFFHLLGSDPNYLMNAGKLFLIAISMGAVFMGALTYIGNAPNLLIKSVADQENFPTLSFWRYTFLALLLLVPSFMLVQWLCL